MTAAHDRAARREREAASLVGSRRVRRKFGERAPDVVPVRLADGTVLVPEAKTRKRLPRWFLLALAQARSYVPRVGAIVPLVVLSELGGEPLAMLPLRDLARLLGLSTSPAAPSQLVLVPSSPPPKA